MPSNLRRICDEWHSNDLRAIAAVVQHPAGRMRLSRPFAPSKDVSVTVCVPKLSKLIPILVRNNPYDHFRIGKRQRTDIQHEPSAVCRVAIPEGLSIVGHGSILLSTGRLC